MDDARFAFESYHILLSALGLSLLAAYWLPRLVTNRPPASSALLIAGGIVASLLFPQLVTSNDPLETPALWEKSGEIVVIVVLFATGLRVDDLGNWRLWRPTIGLLAVAMPLTVAAVALLGWGLAGMTMGGAVLLGAVLAPTDPVLAGDLQIGPPREGREHPVRFALTTEAGLNDGLAFPFVYLALYIASEGPAPSVWMTEWLLWDVGYRIVAGAVLGAGIGWLLGRLLFRAPGGNSLAETGPGVLALAGVFLTYGLVELAEGYGFIAALVAGLVCRRAESEHEFHGRLHSFAEAVEHAVSAVLLVLIGVVMPSLLPYLDWTHVAIGVGLLLVIRPLTGWIGLIGSDLAPRGRVLIATYGVRGIGSLYYLGYAASNVDFIDAGPLWAMVTFTIFASTILHGLTASRMLERLEENER